MTPIFAQTFLLVHLPGPREAQLTSTCRHGDHNPDYQKSGLGGGIDGVLAEFFMCDQVRPCEGLSTSSLIPFAEWISIDPFSSFLRRSVDSPHRRRDIVALPLRAPRRRSPPRTDCPRPGHWRSVDLRSTTRPICRSQRDCHKLERRQAGKGGCSRSRLPRWRQLPPGQGLGEGGGSDQRWTWSRPRYRECASFFLFGRAVSNDLSFAVGGKGTLVRSIRSTRPGGNVWVIGCVLIFLPPSSKSSTTSRSYMSDYAEQEEEKVEFAKEILYSQGASSFLSPRRS